MVLFGEPLCPLDVKGLGKILIAAEDLAEYITTTRIGCCNRSARVLDRVNLWCRNRGGPDLFIGENLRSRRVVDSKKLELIKVFCLPQLGRHPQWVFVVRLFELSTIDFDVFPLAPWGDNGFGKFEPQRCIP